MPTRPQISGRERRVYALIGTLPYSGAQSAHFSFDMTAESFLEGHTRIFDWLPGVPGECVYDNLRTVVAKRDKDEIRWNQRFLHFRGYHAFHATACTPATPREKGSGEGGVRHVKTGFWPARRIVSLQDPRRAIRRLARARLQRPPAFDRPLRRLRSARRGARSAQALAAGQLRLRLRALKPRPGDGYLRFARSFYRTPEALVHQRVELRADRDTVWIVNRGVEVARYLRSYEPGSCLPAPRLRPEPPPAARPAEIVIPDVVAPELADYAALPAMTKTKPAAGERLPYLLSKLKAPRVLERLEQTAAKARDESWPYEQFLEVLLEAEVFARDASD